SPHVCEPFEYIDRCGEIPIPPDPPPPVDPPPPECCPNGSRLYWPDSDAALGVYIDVSIGRYIASTGVLDRQWTTRVEGTANVPAACEQMRTTIQAHRTAQGGSRQPHIAGTQSYTVDLQGFSGDAGYPGAGSNQVQTNYMGLQVNFGNHNVLPSGAGVVFDLIDGHAFNVSRRVIGITIAPGNVVTLTGTSRVPQAVLNQLQAGANTLLSTSNGGDPFYYGANIGFRSVGPIVEGLFRYEVDIYIG